MSEVADSKASLPDKAASLHNKIIPFSRLKQILPDRIKFLNTQERAKIDAQLRKKEPISFLPTYLLETHMQDIKYDIARYKIVLMGIFKDGRKVNVILDGIEPYFEIQLNSTTKKEQETEGCKILQLLEEAEIGPDRFEFINAKPFKYYQVNKSKFMRLYYSKTKTRTQAINLVRKADYKTATDDLASYYRVVCRDYLTTFSTWATLTDYASDAPDNLKGETYRVNIKNYKAFDGDLPADMLKDKTLECCWDIETWSEDGAVPMPDHANHKIFCIGLTFQWVNEKDPFLKICLCDLPACTRPGYLTVVCGNERNLISAFGQVFSLMRPEFIVGFNDSDYDWNWVIRRATQYKGLLSQLAKDFDSTVPYKPYSDETAFKWAFKKEMVKVEAETYIDGHSFMLPGYIPIDVRTIFRRLYPTAEQSSLKWFLSKNKLGGKEDMPYEKMFKIYREYSEFLKVHSDESADILRGKEVDFNFSQWTKEETDRYEKLKTDLADINHYCVIDALRCHDLMNVRCVIMDHREVSNLAYTSVYDAVYRANGMKVRNLTIAEGQQSHFNIRFTNIANESSDSRKYPGAFVFPPDKGLKTTKLSMEERTRKAADIKQKPKTHQSDFSADYSIWEGTPEEELSQYRGLIDKYGAVVTEDLIDEIEKKENIKISKKFRTFWIEKIGRPITGLDFSSLYPSLIRTYNFSPEYCILDKELAKKVAATGQKLTKVDFMFGNERQVGYFIWHNNKYDPKEPGFQFGVYPYILDKLFNKRTALKKQMKKFVHRIEEIDAMSKEEQDRLSEEYADNVFNKNYLNSKQNALKVFMNTFYGEAGNKRSPFFVLEVAGGITSYGQKNIKLAFAFAKGAGCKVYYGDSVASYTPVLVKIDDVIHHCEIQDIVEEKQYSDYNNGKQIAILENTYVWSDVGWTKVKHLIRHKTDKPLLRVITDKGVIDVTPDHSLLNSSKQAIKPSECLGVELLTNELPTEHLNIEKIKLDRPSISYVLQGDVLYAESHLSMAKLCLDLKKIGLDYRILHSSGGVLSDSTQIEHKFSVLANKPEHMSFVDPNKVKHVIKLLDVNTDYVYDFETENHHFSAGVGNLVVHNTDSLYLSTPEQYFAQADKDFYTGKISKLEYWTKLVEITFQQINPVRDGVNAAFIADNETKFLSMAYEEVLYPVAFTAKKKYYGIAHETIPNFSPKELFIRGLEVKKRGVSDLLKTIFMEIMWKSCNPDNLYDLMELVLNKIDEIYARKWSAKDFIQTGVYRPNKNNPKYKRLVERMAERKIDLIKPNERFEYVIVKKYPYTYDFRGRKKEISVGDKLELAEIADRDGMEIDLDYYMQGSVNGQLARLVTYHDRFYEAPTDDTPDDLKIAEDKIYKHATKFIEEYCSKYYANYNTFGKTHQSIFKKVNKLSTCALKEYDDLASDLLGANVDYEDFENWFVEFTNKQAEKMIAGYGETFVKSEIDKLDSQIINKHLAKKEEVKDESFDDTDEDSSDLDDQPKLKTPGRKAWSVELKSELKTQRQIKIKDLQAVYYGRGAKSFLRVKEIAYQNTMSILKKRLRENLDNIMKLYSIYNSNIEELMQLIRNKVQIGPEHLKPTKQAVEYKITDFDFDENQLDDELSNQVKNNISQMVNDKRQQAAILNLKEHYTNMLAAHITYLRTVDIVRYLKTRRDVACKIVTRPSDQELREMNQRDAEEDLSEIIALDI